jgi:hypothetical protein
MQRGTQLRYWSICNNEGLPSGKTTGPRFQHTGCKASTR